MNHSEVDITGRALDIVFKRWNGPVSAYPNSGDWTPPNWGFDTVISPEEFVGAAEPWVARGVQIVGGCCGIGPDHIRLLRTVAWAQGRGSIRRTGKPACGLTGYANEGHNAACTYSR